MAAKTRASQSIRRTSMRSEPPPIGDESTEGADTASRHVNGNGDSNGHRNGRQASAVVGAPNVAESTDAECGAAKCHFQVAPPRHFLYPAILLLLGEEARHGYRLVDAILRFGFGPVDRPSIYRALSDLSHDGLLVSWEAESTAGSPRQVHALSETGRIQLAEWMRVIALERDGLEQVLRRFEMWEDDRRE